MKFKPLILAAASAIAFAPLSVCSAGPAHADPRCPDPTPGAYGPWLARMQEIHDQCMQAAHNQDYCGDARGCAPGDPCVVGSAYERAICTDTRLGAR